MALKNHSKLRLFFILIIFILIISVPVVSNIIIVQFYGPKLVQMNSGIQKHKEAILKDLDLLSKNPLFPEIHFEKDAQEFLSQHVSWDGKQILPLQDESHQKLKQWDPQNIRWDNATEIKAQLTNSWLDSIDTSWMDQLSQYDSWVWSTHPKMFELINEAKNKNSIERIEIFSSLPIPDLQELKKWTYIHFLQKYKHGHGQEGLNTLHHMAYLCHSAGFLVSQMMAVALLNVESKIEKSLNLKKTIAFTDEQVLAYRRVSWAWTGIINAAWFNQWDPSFDPYLKQSSGLCAGTWEETMGLEGLKDFFEPRAPLEYSFEKNFADGRALQTRLINMCHFKNYDVFRSEIPASVNPFIVDYSILSAASQENSPSHHNNLNFARIPYLRRLIGLQIMTIATPNWTKLYE
jgi:hypothetical protein